MRHFAGFANGTKSSCRAMEHLPASFLPILKVGWPHFDLFLSSFIAKSSSQLSRSVRWMSCASTSAWWLIRRPAVSCVILAWSLLTVPSFSLQQLMEICSLRSSCSRWDAATDSRQAVKKMELSEISYNHHLISGQKQIHIALLCNKNSKVKKCDLSWSHDTNALTPYWNFWKAFLC